MINVNADDDFDNINIDAAVGLHDVHISYAVSSCATGSGVMIDVFIG